jgi:hypothetical protein
MERTRSGGDPGVWIRLPAMPPPPGRACGAVPVPLRLPLFSGIWAAERSSISVQRLWQRFHTEPENRWSWSRSCPTLDAPDDDPYLWLEDIEGPQALDWVEAQDAATLKRFGDGPFVGDRDTLPRQPLDAHSAEYRPRICHFIWVVLTFDCSDRWQDVRTVV